MFNNLHIYKNGSELPMPRDISDRSKYMFYLIGNFEELQRSQRFALAESKILSNKWKMFCVCEVDCESKSDQLCPYSVCEVYDLQEVLK